MEALSSGRNTVVVGGGPAGCAAAITLARAGHRVSLLELGVYPRQKVCGEFVSAEALPLLSHLLREDAPALIETAPIISRARLWLDHRRIETEIAPAARSITRFDLDHALWNAAVRAGAEALQGIAVTAVERESDHWVVRTARGVHLASAVIDASGRWSRLNARPVSSSSNVGIKAHVAGKGEDNVVDLYFYAGGYCGVQTVADGVLNVCAFSDARRASTLREVFELHPELHARSRDWDCNQRELVTAPLVPGLRAPFTDGVLRAGDAAGFLDPFLGDGISLALRSGALAGGMSADGAAYSQEFARQFGGAFRIAALGRRAWSLPRFLRGLLLPLLTSNRLAALSRRARG